MKIYFYRHGETTANVEKKFCGSTDVHLTENGKQQLADKVKNFGYPQVDRVYCSSESKSFESSCIIFPETGIFSLEELNEMDFGYFENKSVDELVENEVFKSWLRAEINIPGGETVEELTDRCFEALNEIIGAMFAENLQEVAVFTSAGVIKNILVGFALPKYAPNSYNIDFGEGIEVYVNAQLWSQGIMEIVGVIPYASENNQENSGGTP
jgi:alpha-ribazole phosphatase